MPRIHHAAVFACSLLLFACLMAGCSRGVDWSERERESAAHIQASLQATSDAAMIANAIHDEDDLAANRDRLLQALRAAHLHAARVDDSVLDKLHSRLYSKFRLDYQRALARMIRAHERGDRDAAQASAADIRAFMQWYRAESHTFRWWEDAAAR